MKVLVQPPAQIRVSLGVRWGCSGPYPVASWKSLRRETAWPLWATSSTVEVSLWGKGFCLHLFWTFLFFSLCLWLSSSNHALLCRLCLIYDLLIGTGGAAVSAPKAVSSPGWESPVLSVTPDREVLQPPGNLMALPIIWLMMSDQ